MSYPGHSFGGVLPLCRGAVSVFNSPSRLGYIWFVITFCRYTQLNDPSFLFLTIKFSMSTKLSFQVLLCITHNSVKHQLFVSTQSYNQAVLFQAIQFSISHLFVLSLNVKKFIWFIDRTLSGTTTPSKSGPGSDGNERGVLRIPQSSSITTALPSGCLISYPGNA